MRRRDRVNVLNSRAFPIEHYSLKQIRRESRIPMSIQEHVILFVDLVPRMSQALSEIAIVCEQDETLSLRIEPADVEQAREFLRKQIENRVTGVRIFSRRNK